MTSFRRFNASDLSRNGIELVSQRLNRFLEDCEGEFASSAAALAAHIADPTDAHAATAITNTPAGTIAATTVQAAINELDGDISSFYNRGGKYFVETDGSTPSIKLDGGLITLYGGYLASLTGAVAIDSDSFLQVDNTTEATSVSSASVTIAGGLGVAKSIFATTVNAVTNLQINGTSIFARANTWTAVQTISRSAGDFTTFAATNTDSAYAATMEVYNDLGNGSAGNSVFLRAYGSAVSATTIFGVSRTGAAALLSYGSGRTAFLIGPWLSDAPFVFGMNATEVMRIPSGSAGLTIGATALVGSERLRVAGGSAATAGATDVCIGAGVISAGTRVIIGGTTDASSATDTSASLHTEGGASIEKSLWVGTSIHAGDDTNAISYLGRGFIGYAVGGASDVFYLGHYDMNNATSFALAQDSAGNAYLNAASGKTIYLLVNNSTVATITPSATTINGAVSPVQVVASNTGGAELWLSGNIEATDGNLIDTNGTQIAWNRSAGGGESVLVNHKGGGSVGGFALATWNGATYATLLTVQPTVMTVAAALNVIVNNTTDASSSTDTSASFHTEGGASIEKSLYAANLYSGGEIRATGEHFRNSNAVSITCTNSGTWYDVPNTDSANFGMIMFRDATSGGIAIFTWDAAHSGVQTVKNDIGSLEAQLSGSKMQIRVTGGTTPRQIKHIKLVASHA